jgi:hypothetical protein
MAATPQAGVAYFRGLNSGNSYARGFYNTDVSGALVRWDVGAGIPAAATSGSDFITFDEPVQLYDLSVTTGIVDTKNVRVVANYAPTIFTFNWATHLNSLSLRPAISVQFKPQTRISLGSSV